MCPLVFESILKQLSEPTDLQLEGGEPLTHPSFWGLVDRARAHELVAHLVLNTNGSLLPHTVHELKDFLRQMGAPLLLKVSYNHHISGKDANLLDKLRMLAELQNQVTDFTLVINLRRRPEGDRDQKFRKQLDDAGLLPYTNDFYLQAYGRAENRSTWPKPFVVRSDFLMINPDGTKFWGDLEERSRALVRLDERLSSRR